MLQHGRRFAATVLFGAGVTLTGCSPWPQLGPPPRTSDPLISTTVTDGGMEPTFRAGSTVTVEVGAAVHPGEVAMVEVPGNQATIRRVVAVAGDSVMIDGSQSPPALILITQEFPHRHQQEELYLAPVWTVDRWCCDDQGRSVGPQQGKPYAIPAGDVYVLGDNRDVLPDSRSYGAISSSQIRGRVELDPRVLQSPGEPWTRAGSRVDSGIISVSRGPSHCGLQSMNVLILSWPLGAPPSSTAERRMYLRVPGDASFLAGRLLGSPDVNATRPASAVDTGYEAAGVRLYLDPTNRDQYAYLDGNGYVERWPRADPPLFCL